MEYKNHSFKSAPNFFKTSFIVFAGSFDTNSACLAFQSRLLT